MESRYKRIDFYAPSIIFINVSVQVFHEKSGAPFYLTFTEQTEPNFGDHFFRFRLCCLIFMHIHNGSKGSPAVGRRPFVQQRLILLALLLFRRVFFHDLLCDTNAVYCCAHDPSSITGTFSAGVQATKA